MNLYEILGINPDASPDGIRRAYRKQAMKHHPDRNGDKAVFQQVQHAYEVLSDVERRKRYDETGDTSTQAQTEEMALRAMALENLAKLLNKVVNEMDVEHDDLVEAINAVLMKVKSSVEAERDQILKAIERHEKAEKRFKVKEGENEASSLLRSVIAGLNMKLNTSEHELKLAILMIDIMDRHEYEHDPKPPTTAHGGWPSSTQIFFPT